MTTTIALLVFLSLSPFAGREEGERMQKEEYVSVTAKLSHDGVHEGRPSVRHSL